MVTQDTECTFPVSRVRKHTAFIVQIIGASVSEPHIDEFAVNPYISVVRTLCRKSLAVLVLASCVKSKPGT